MTAYSVHWECPLCEMTKTRLAHRFDEDESEPTERWRSAAMGLLGHIRQMTDDAHGGARGRYPDAGEWTTDALKSHVTVRPIGEERSVPIPDRPTPGFE